MKKKSSLEPNIFLTLKCNQKCVFCSANGEDRLMKKKDILACVNSGHKTLAFEGGEPLLAKSLSFWIEKAKKAGADNIILLTNGVLLTEKKISELSNKGVAKFEFNFPSHIKKIDATLTGSAGFKKRIEAIKKTLIKVPDSVILTFVMNSVNYKTLPDYIAFVAKEFEGIFFLAVNFIKIKGLVRKRKWLVPELSAVYPYLKKAVKKAKEKHIPLIFDGFPLCQMKDFEEYARDIDRILRGDKTYLSEKAKLAKCRECSLKKICSGPRKDYVSLYGNAEVKPSSKKPSIIVQKVKKGQLGLNA